MNALMENPMDAEIRGLTVSRGDYDLVVEDVTKPLWYGDYHNGKLAIYKADINGDVNVPADALHVVAVFTDSENVDFIFSGHYDGSLTMEQIASDICANAYKVYQNEKHNLNPGFYVQGNDSIH